MAALDKITLRGFKSIRQLDDLQLGRMNVLIGANGAGKSNFVEFFRMLRAMVESRLQLYLAKNGPADGYFFNGVKHTKQIDVELCFGQNKYVFDLQPTADGRIVIAHEQTQYVPKGALRTIGTGSFESTLPSRKDDAAATGPFAGPNRYVWDSISSWQVYHFHDTSLTAGMRRDVGFEQSRTLQSDASNLAAFLLLLKHVHPDRYELLRRTIQRIAPFFDDFDLRVTEATPENLVRLMWRRTGSEYIFSPGHFSDGTIRFICLATALTQPKPPTTIVLDEPELGLHPEALSVLGGLIRSASARMQIVLATQSPLLVSEFEPEDIVAVDQIDGASQFRRLDAGSLDAWMNDYSLGELWQKGTLRGGVING